MLRDFGDMTTISELSRSVSVPMESAAEVRVRSERTRPHTTDRKFASGPLVGPCRVSKRRLPRSRTSNQSSYAGRTTAREDADRFFSGLVRPVCFHTKPEGWDSL